MMCNMDFFNHMVLQEVNRVHVFWVVCNIGSFNLMEGGGRVGVIQVIFTIWCLEGRFKCVQGM